MTQASNDGNGAWSVTLPTTAPGDYDVTVTATNAQGQTVTATGTLSVNAPPVVTPITVTLDDTQTSEVSPEMTGACTGDPDSITVTVDANAYPATISADTWTLAAGVIADLDYTTHAVSVTAQKTGTDDATDTALLTVVAPVAAPTLVDFDEGRIFQRANASAQVTVEGTRPDIKPIEAQIVEAGTNTVVVDWTSIPAAGTDFSGIVNVPEGGWYNARVRYADASAQVDGSAAWGVGIIIGVIGQSNVEHWWDGWWTQEWMTNQTGTEQIPNAHIRTFKAGVWSEFDYGSDGAIAYANEVYENLTNPVPVGLIEGAVGGAALLEEAVSPPSHGFYKGWWLELQPGTNYPNFIDDVQAVGGDIEQIVWQQGERDGKHGASKADYTQGLTTLFSRLRNDCGNASDQPNLPIMVGPIGGVSSSSDFTGAKFEAIQSAQKEIVDALPDLTLGPNKTDLPIISPSNSHLNRLGYTRMGQRYARVSLLMMGEPAGYAYPTIASLEAFSDTQTRVTINHDGGNDFTPNDISGFKVWDNGQVFDGSAVRESADSILVTHTALTGQRDVTYQYDDDVAYPNPFADNAPVSMDLMFYRGTVATQTPANYPQAPTTTATSSTTSAAPALWANAQSAGLVYASQITDVVEGQAASLVGGPSIVDTDAGRALRLNPGSTTGQTIDAPYVNLDGLSSLSYWVYVAFTGSNSTQYAHSLGLQYEDLQGAPDADARRAYLAYHVGLVAGKASHFEVYLKSTNSSYFTLRSDEVILDDQPHIIGLDWTGTTATIYLDGVAVGSDTFTETLSNLANNKHPEIMGGQRVTGGTLGKKDTQSPHFDLYSWGLNGESLGAQAHADIAVDPYAMFRVGEGGGDPGADPIADLFAGSEQGAYYDPSDLATLFQDSAGTTPVTADGQPVGLVLDQSPNAVPASQATDAQRPIYQSAHDRLVLDKVDDALTLTVPTGGWAGTLVLATDQGTASYGVAIPAGDYDLVGAYFPGTAIIGAVFRDGEITPAEKAATENHFIGNGATASYGAASDFINYWRSKGLTSFPLIDTSGGTSFSNAWRNNSLTSFPLIDTSSGTNFNATWFDNNLTSFPLLDTSSSVNFRSAWSGNNLTSFPLLDTSSGVNFTTAWSSNPLESFPANMFDNIKGGNFEYAFNGTNLTQASIDGILESLVTSGINTGIRVFDQSGGSPPSVSIGHAAIDTLRGRGWTVSVTGGYQTTVAISITVAIQDTTTTYASPPLSGTCTGSPDTVNVVVDGTDYPATINADTWSIAAGTINDLVDRNHTVVVTASKAGEADATDTATLTVIEAALAAPTSPATSSAQSSAPALWASALSGGMVDNGQLVDEFNGTTASLVGSPSVVNTSFGDALQLNDGGRDGETIDAPYVNLDGATALSYYIYAAFTGSNSSEGEHTLGLQYKDIQGSTNAEAARRLLLDYRLRPNATGGAPKASFKLYMYDDVSIFDSSEVYLDGSPQVIHLDWDGTTITLYVDGVSVGSGTATSPLQSTSTTKHPEIMGGQRVTGGADATKAKEASPQFDLYAWGLNDEALGSSAVAQIANDPYAAFRRS